MSKKEIWQDLLLIAAITVFLTLLLGMWDSFPRGNDANRWVSETRFFLDNWPSSRWNYQWAAGMPFLLWYLPLPYYISSAIAIFTGIKFSLNLLATLSYILLGLGIYGFIYEIAETRSASLIASLLALTSPCLWVSWEIEGVYAMTISSGFLTVTLWALMKYLKEKSRKNTILTIILFSFTLLSHLLVAVVTSFSALIIVLLYNENNRERIYDVIKIFTSSALLTAYFYIPFIATRPEQQYGLVSYNREIFTYILSTSRNMFFPFSRSIDTVLSPLIIPLFLFAIMKGSTRIKNKIPLKKIIMSIGFVTLLLFLYTIIPTGVHLNGFEPSNSLHFLSIFLAIMCGLLLSTSNNILNNQRSHLFILSIIILAFVYMPLNFTIKVYSSHNENIVVSRLLTNETESNSFRFGIPAQDYGISQWFNEKYSTPQTRHWYAQGIIGKKWLDLFYHSVWEVQNNIEETNFLLDWYATKWLITTPNIFLSHTDIHEKFQLYSEYFSLIESQHEIDGFIFKEARPIISTTKAPTILIVGSTDNVFRSLSYSNFNSRYVTPIWGSEFVEDYTIEELQQFDSVFLYGFNYHDRELAWKLLERYVTEGGGLIVDTGFSPDASSDFIPNPCPVEKTQGKEFGTTWDFIQQNSEITEEINFNDFSAALYGDAPWGVSASDNESVRQWAQPVLWLEGEPLVAMGEYGKGRVVWCGLNLPYHIMSYQNVQESLFISNMITWVTKLESDTDLSDIIYSAERNNPEKVTITIDSAVNGVLFKENFFPNWIAHSVDPSGEKERLNIQRAGPDFMYVNLHEVTEYPVSVVFLYGRSWSENVGILLSSMTVMSLVVYSFGFPYVNKIFGGKLPDGVHLPDKWINDLLRGEIMKVKNEITNVLDSEPNNAYGRFGLGCVFAIEGYRGEAVKEWKTSVTLLPDFGEAHYVLAWAFYEKGESQKGYEHVEKALATDVSLDSVKALIDKF